MYIWSAEREKVQTKNSVSDKTILQNQGRKEDIHRFTKHEKVH